MAKRSDVIAALIAIGGAGALMAARSAMQRARIFEFRGKVVLITGGSRGLGLVLARQLAAAGARVILTARSGEDLEEAASEMSRAGAEVITLPCDLRDNDAVQAMIREAVRRAGRIDLLINNAGTIAVGPLESMTLEDFKEQMDSNFWSAVHTSLAVVPHMRARGTGRIVNITSIGGKIAVPHLLAYSASKFAMVGFSRGLRTELYKDGIIVTTICPGLMRTGSPRNADFKGQNEAEYSWFAISDSAPVLSMDAEDAARDILEATRRGDVEMILTGPAKIGALVDEILPELSGDLLSIVGRFMPKNVPGGEHRVKGRDSETAATRSVLTAPTQEAALRNNEV